MSKFICVAYALTYKKNRDTIFKFGLRSKGKLMSMNVPRETSWVGSACGSQFIRTTPTNYIFSPFAEQIFCHAFDIQCWLRATRAFCSLSCRRIWCLSRNAHTRSQPPVHFAYGTARIAFFSLTLKVCTGFQVQTRKAASASQCPELL